MKSDCLWIAIAFGFTGGTCNLNLSLSYVKALGRRRGRFNSVEVWLQEPTRAARCCSLLHHPVKLSDILFFIFDLGAVNYISLSSTNLCKIGPHDLCT